MSTRYNRYGPWATEEEAMKALTEAWEQEKADGIACGAWEPLPGGGIRGRGDPTKAFEKIDKYRARRK